MKIVALLCMLNVGQCIDTPNYMFYMHTTNIKIGQHYMCCVPHS